MLALAKQTNAAVPRRRRLRLRSGPEGLCNVHLREFLATLPAAELAARSAAAQVAREPAAPAIAAAVRRAYPMLGDETVLRWAAEYTSVDSFEASRTEAAAEAARDIAARDAYDASLRARGLAIVAIKGAGNCLFGAVAHKVYGDEELHALVRAACCDYLAARHARETRGSGATPGPLLGDVHEVRLFGGVEAYRPHLRFADALKGHQLYGSLVQRPNSLASIVVTKA